MTNLVYNKFSYKYIVNSLALIKKFIYHHLTWSLEEKYAYFETFEMIELSVYH